MSNYHGKYLKYKKKYINLKNNYLNNLYEKEGGGNALHIIFFYDNTNSSVNDVFLKIKENYKKYLADKMNNLDVPYTFKINFKKELNGLFNIFTYELKDNKIKPYFVFNVDNLCLTNYCQNVTSKRMRHLVFPFKKAIDIYIKSLVMQFNLNNVLQINNTFNCNILEHQSNNILKFINDNINNENMTNSVKSLLQLVKIYQDLTIQEIVQYQINRIGGYAGLLSSITPPNGTDETNTHIEKNDLTQEQIHNLIKNELTNYKNENIKQLGDIGLKISNIKFNNVNDMIYLKIKGDHAQVMNIFENVK